MKPTQENYVPSHPDICIVEFSRDGQYSSCLRATASFKAGQILVPLRGLTPAPQRAYTSVQCGPAREDNIELNSDLVYVNHSCNPTVAFDLSPKDPAQWHLRALQDIRKGDILTFFYPSTEWDMDQPFDCQCGDRTCLGKIRGAKYLSVEELKGRGFINQWIWDLVALRDGRTVTKSRSTAPSPLTRL
ncbi:hypothetical protein CCMSSC00406_0004921 [Pleurotus cornucopiae]|uniref:Uncharacterized protein n=1 Tax=Pleurotus cornucopiae TaxID=5321 RepID=A0ACB7J2F7_PLECO|nr:hypothetical protein CCMSSC00406_0004921 [Pleurotus cornucopiae]